MILKTIATYLNKYAYELTNLLICFYSLWVEVYAQVLAVMFTGLEFIIGLFGMIWFKMSD